MPAWEIYFLRTAFTILLLLAIILRYFIKGYVVKNPVKFFKNKVTAKLYQNNQKWIDIVVVILYCIIIGYVFYSGMIPLLKDYPLLREKKYNTIIGITMYSCMERDSIVKIRNIQIKDLYSDEEIVLHCLESGIEKDEYIVVNYLPNSKTGYVVKHQKLQ